MYTYYIILLMYIHDETVFLRGNFYLIKLLILYDGWESDD